MANGPKPKPTRLKVVQGNPGKRPLPENEPEPEAVTDFTPPAGMSERAGKHWETVAKKLSDAQILTVLDEDALRMYCEYYARWIEAMDEIKKDGMIVESPNGYPIASPMLAIANKAADGMAKMMAEFGMTPSSRTKIKTTPKPRESDGFDEL